MVQTLLHTKLPKDGRREDWVSPLHAAVTCCFISSPKHLSVFFVLTNVHKLTSVTIKQQLTPFRRSTFVLNLERKKQALKPTHQ